MLTRFRSFWQQLQESLWFVPSLMVVGAFGLAYGLIEFDARTSYDGAKRYPFLFGAGAEGSRGMLTAIAGSMLTVATLVFTLTLSTISQVSSQYSPRVLRNFMRDRGNQFVMGYFVSVFVYCLLVLGTIRGTEEQKFVPSTAVLMGVVQALGGVGALIYFIHHIAESLQTGAILERITQEIQYSLDELFPPDVGEPVDATEAAASQAAFTTPTGWQRVCARQAGYVQGLDGKELLRWAGRHHALVRVEQPVGAFVSEQTVLFSAWPDSPTTTPLPRSALDALRELVVTARHRNVEQDVAFGVQQLVDIALKALSPGINDPTTAIMAVDHLGLASQRLASRPFPPQLRADDAHRARVLVPALDFAGYMRLAFDPVRLSAKGSYAVLARLLGALAQVAEATRLPARQAAVRTQAELLLGYAEQTLATDYEKQALRSLYQELQPAWLAAAGTEVA